MASCSLLTDRQDYGRSSNRYFDTPSLSSAYRLQPGPSFPPVSLPLPPSLPPGPIPSLARKPVAPVRPLMGHSQSLPLPPSLSFPRWPPGRTLPLGSSEGPSGNHQSQSLQGGGAAGSSTAGTKRFPAEALAKQGVTMQELTVPRDMNISTNSPDQPPIALRSGQRVMLIRTPKGIYLRMGEKIVKIRVPQALLSLAKGGGGGGGSNDQAGRIKSNGPAEVVTISDSSDSEQQQQQQTSTVTTSGEQGSNVSAATNATAKDLLALVASAANSPMSTSPSTSVGPSSPKASTANPAPPTESSQLKDQAGVPRDDQTNE
jgi:hypothetical protein